VTPWNVTVWDLFAKKDRSLKQSLKVDGLIRRFHRGQLPRELYLSYELRQDPAELRTQLLCGVGGYRRIIAAIAAERILASCLSRLILFVNSDIDIGRRRRRSSFRELIDNQSML